MEIPNYPNYLIYRDGKIKSLRFSDRFLNPCLRKDGYLTTRLYHNKKGKTELIHQLVAKTYIPNPNNYPTVDHINRNKLDNRVENLRWATRKQQVANRNILSTNTSGHKNIHFRNDKKLWAFQCKYKIKRNKSKIMCICYKFGFILRIKAGHFS